MKTTIVDVAKACNVSVATVSRVINGKITLMKVLKYYMKQMGSHIIL